MIYVKVYHKIFNRNEINNIFIYKYNFNKILYMVQKLFIITININHQNY